jgi:phosphonopyruvate decarboxylase
VINPAKFCTLLKQQGVDHYFGVPDSLLKNLCAYVDDTLPAKQHVIAANEGNAVALAIGHYLGSAKPAVVYMQNSGLGNAINPLTSLADPQVYSIPLLMVIGWRGEPGVKDEPQHVKQGQISAEQLKVLDIPFRELDGHSEVEGLVAPLLKLMTEQNRPVAILVKKDTFSKADLIDKQAGERPSTAYSMLREQALKLLLGMLSDRDVVVSTTGKTSREVFEIRQNQQQKSSDFLTVGGMGHTSSIAMGVANAASDKTVVAIDGDGSMLMHLGALPIIGCHGGTNLIHVVLNNQSHESVGGQPTVAGRIDIGQIALASGYKFYYCATDQSSLEKHWATLINQQGPILFEVKIATGSREDLGRPTSSPVENKQQFMLHVGSV